MKESRKKTYKYKASIISLTFSNTLIVVHTRAPIDTYIEHSDTALLRTTKNNDRDNMVSTRVGLLHYTSKNFS